MGAKERFFLVVSLLLVLFWGCARRPPFDLGLGRVRGPEDVVTRINENAQRLHSLRAGARIHLANIPQSRLAKASVLFAEPSRYRVKFNALFGRTVAVMTVRHEEVSIYLPLANRLYEGQPSAEQMGHVLGIQMSFADLMEAMVGTVRLPSMSDLLGYRTMKDGYALSFKRPEGRQEVQVASDGLRVQKVEFFDDHGRSFLVKTLRDYRAMGEVVRPSEVTLTLPDKGEELQIIFTHQQVNHLIREEEFQLDLPASVERILLHLE